MEATLAPDATTEVRRQGVDPDPRYSRNAVQMP
jgi:hypothetical protein